jgi:outer membrane lipoprotein-sorting protein
MKNITKQILAVMLMLTISIPAFSLNANEIAKKYEDTTKYKSSIMIATLTIKDRLGTSRQQLKSYSDGDTNTLIEIISGPDRGQKVLRKETSIYLYYPDADQIIRLQGSALKESFMGSDFSYEDLSDDSSILKNYSVELTDETEDTYTLYLTATTRKMTYQREELIIDKENFFLKSATLMSSSGRALRSLENSNIKLIDGYYVAGTTVMKDLIKQQGSTTMEIDSIELDKKINPSTFTKENLSW